MRRLAIAAAIALLTVPAYAQFNMGGGDGSRDKTRYTEEQRRTEAEVETGLQGNGQEHPQAKPARLTIPGAPSGRPNETNKKPAR